MYVMPSFICDLLLLFAYIFVCLFQFCLFQDNPKDYVLRDNMLKCAMCHFKYCFVCLEPCFGAYHFNEYGCTRYTSFEVDSKRLRQEKREAETKLSTQ